MHLAHFPVRSPEQIRRKVINLWEGHLSNPSRIEGHAFHVRKLYDRCKHDPRAISLHELREMALRYAVTEGMEMKDLRSILDQLRIPKFFN